MEPDESFQEHWVQVLQTFVSVVNKNYLETWTVIRQSSSIKFAPNQESSSEFPKTLLKSVSVELMLSLS